MLGSILGSGGAEGASSEGAQVELRGAEVSSEGAGLGLRGAE